MKLLYFDPVGSIGGGQMCLLDLLGSTTRARPGWSLVVVLGDEGPLRSAVEGLGVRCVVEPMPDALAMLGDSGGGGLKLLARMAASSMAAASYLGKLRRLFRSEQPDLVQTNGMKAHLLGNWAAPGSVPVVWHLHDYLGSRPAMARLLRAASRRPRLSAVAVSRSVLDDARAVLGPDVAIRAIHNAVDVHRFAPGPGGPFKGDWLRGAAEVPVPLERDTWPRERGLAPGEYVRCQSPFPRTTEAEVPVPLDRASGWPDAPPGTVRVGLVATFARWKGHDVFFEAISRIGADRPARFYVVGGPIYRSSGSQWSMDDLKAEAARRGVLDRVGFVGPVADPARALRSLDIAVHASTRPEPFGRAIVEGMATGLAVVAILDGGAAELFDDGETALGCLPNDPASLAKAIDRLIESPALRRRLGENGRKAAMDRFDAARLFEAWSPVYSEATRPDEGGDPARQRASRGDRPGSTRIPACSRTD